MFLERMKALYLHVTTTNLQLVVNKPTHSSGSIQQETRQCHQQWFTNLLSSETAHVNHIIETYSLLYETAEEQNIKLYFFNLLSFFHNHNYKRRIITQENLNDAKQTEKLLAIRFSHSIEISSIDQDSMCRKQHLEINEGNWFLEPQTFWVNAE